MLNNIDFTALAKRETNASELGFSWITSRSKHPKQSQAAQDKFKKWMQAFNSGMAALLTNERGR